jgi:AcrR family transcriptional regulator
MTATAKAALRRAELLDVAINLFYEKGYAHTTLQDIADRMGFTKAAIYYYAKNKEELLVEIYTAIVEPAIAEARALAAAPATDGATQFVALIEQHLQTFLHNVEANAVFEVQNFSLSEAARLRIHALGREYDAVLSAVYDNGIADGSIAPGDATIAVNAVIGMCNSAHRWYRPRGKFTVNQVISQLVGIVDSGVRMRGSDPQSEEI